MSIIPLISTQTFNFNVLLFNVFVFVGTSSGHTVKSFAEKEATPITTSYSSYMPPSIDESISEYR